MTGQAHYITLPSRSLPDLRLPARSALDQSRQGAAKPQI